jgi:hypothetical protein
MEGDEQKILLRGMRDGLYSFQENTFGIFETKTKSRIVEQEILDGLQYDMQTMMYCFCTFLETGNYPNQVTYNVIRRPEMYRRKNEESVNYFRRLGEDIDSRPDHYFKRYRVHILKADIEMFRDKTLTPLLKLFVQWWESIKKNPLSEDANGVPGRWSSPYHYLNSSALVGKYGKTAMWDAIFGDKSIYKIRQEVFPELEESFQVTWNQVQVEAECPF